jgi:hypothetical protein
LFTLELHSNGRLRPAVEAEPGYRVHACKFCMNSCDVVVTRVHVMKLKAAKSWKVFNVEGTGNGSPCFMHLRDREEIIPQLNQAQKLVRLDLRPQQT